MAGKTDKVREAGRISCVRFLFSAIRNHGQGKSIYWPIGKEAELMFRGGRNCIIGMFAIAMGAGILIAAIFPTGMLMFLLATLLTASACACRRR